MTKTIIAMTVAALAGTANAQSYGWEDGGDILGSFGNLGSATNVASGTNGVTAFEGNRMLELTENPVGGTPQAYVAFIENLSQGDTITASFWGYDDTPGASPSLRVWGHWATSGDVTSFNGSASGNTTFTDGTGWSQVSHTWTYDSLATSGDALVVEARIYETGSGGNVFYIDGLEVTINSSTATVTFAPAPAGAALLGLGGLVGTRRRR